MKIKTKIVLTFSLLFFFVFSLFSAATIYFSTKAFETELFNNLESTAQSRIDHIQTFYNQTLTQATLLTSRTTPRKTLVSYYKNANENDLEIIRNNLMEAIKTLPNTKSLDITDVNGTVLVSTKKENEGKDYSTKPTFLSGKTDHAMTLNYEDDEALLYVSGPLIFNNEMLGVLVITNKTTPLTAIVEQRTGLENTGEVLIAIEGTNGNPQYISKRLFEYQIAQKSDTYTSIPMRLALQGDQQQLRNVKDYRGMSVMAVTKYLKPLNLGLVTKIDTIEAYHNIYGLIRLKLILFILGLLLFITVSFILARTITKPLEILHHGTEIIEKGNLDYTVGTNAKDEIGQLSRSFDSMTLAIKKSYASVDRKVKEQTKEIQNILEDVEEEKVKADNLASDLKKFQLAVENVSNHIVITDGEGMILYANPVVKQITGFDNTEIIGKKAGTEKLWGGLMPKDFYSELWKTIKTEKKNFSGEIQNKRKNGQRYSAFASISPILDKQENVVFFVGVERDITKEKDVDRMKTEFISLASHQLRTPLSAMKWFLEMLISGDAGKLNKEQFDFVTKVDQSNQRMIELVNSLLNISRIESGRIIIDPKPTDLVSLVHEVVDELKPQLSQNNQKIIISAHKELPLISIDPKLIRHVYMNLLTNAIKYSPKNTEISIFVSKKGNEILSQISDNGYGIPAKNQERIFEKFYRAENIVKRETEGSGLGLYLVKSIVESSNGKIWFKSTENEGTSFWFSLPISGVKPKKGEVTIDS